MRPCCLQALNRPNFVSLSVIGYRLCRSVLQVGHVVPNTKMILHLQLPRTGSSDAEKSQHFHPVHSAPGLGFSGSSPSVRTPVSPPPHHPTRHRMQSSSPPLLEVSTPLRAVSRDSLAYNILLPTSRGTYGSDRIDRVSWRVTDSSLHSTPAS